MTNHCFSLSTTNVTFCTMPGNFDNCLGNVENKINFHIPNSYCVKSVGITHSALSTMHNTRIIHIVSNVGDSKSNK